MNNNIFIPKKINVGLKEDRSTYTGKLAYVIYYDNKGKLRKETSWNSWRKEELGNTIYENVPTSGFVLNKKAGGYGTGWNHRQSKIRVYDPRDFEFEITIENMLYILENSNSIKGKGLEGEFIYGWDGKDLLLMPAESPDYVEIQAFNNVLHENKSIKVKDLKIGATYRTNSNNKVIYMGKFTCYNWRGYSKEKLEHFFANEDGKSFITMASISKRIIEVLDEECVSNYAEIFETLEGQEVYSPYDKSKDKYVEYTLEEFIEKYNKAYTYSYSRFAYKDKDREEYKIFSCRKIYLNDERTEFKLKAFSETRYTTGENIAEGTLEDIYNKLKPCYLNKYLSNGKFYNRSDY